MSTTHTPDEPVSINVDICWEKGGDEIISDCLTLRSDDSIFSAAERLRRIADSLDPPRRSWDRR